MRALGSRKLRSRVCRVVTDGKELRRNVKAQFPLQRRRPSGAAPRLLSSPWPTRAARGHHHAGMPEGRRILRVTWGADRAARAKAKGRSTGCIQRGSASPAESSSPRPAGAGDSRGSCGIAGWPAAGLAILEDLKLRARVVTGMTRFRGPTLRGLTFSGGDAAEMPWKQRLAGCNTNVTAGFFGGSCGYKNHAAGEEIG